MTMNKIENKKEFIVIIKEAFFSDQKPSNHFH